MSLLRATWEAARSRFSRTGVESEALGHHSASAARRDVLCEPNSWVLSPLTGGEKAGSSSLVWLAWGATQCSSKAVERREGPGGSAAAHDPPQAADRRNPDPGSWILH